MPGRSRTLSATWSMDFVVMTFSFQAEPARRAKRRCICPAQIGTAPPGA
jgi:hypothetical protein